jgi:hypothetical protein
VLVPGRQRRRTIFYWVLPASGVVDVNALTLCLASGRWYGHQLIIVLIFSIVRRWHY